MPHITQISASIVGSEKTSFDVYVKPKIPISDSAQDITGIIMINDSDMTVNGAPVDCYAVNDAFSQLLGWLKPHHNVFLIAHNGKRFDYLPGVLADFRLHDESLSQKHLNKRDVDGVLAYQKQMAESRTIRRIYGIKLFNDEMLNSIVDGILYHTYRILKGLLRLAHRHRTKL